MIQVTMMSVHTMLTYHFHNKTTFDGVGLILHIDFAPFNRGATLSIVGQSTFEDRKQRLARSTGYLPQITCYSKPTLL